MESSCQNHLDSTHSDGVLPVYLNKLDSIFRSTYQPRRCCGFLLIPKKNEEKCCHSHMQTIDTQRDECDT